MKKYFSIGEMSKLYNISIETLRHYDRIGILKPEYISKFVKELNIVDIAIPDKTNLVVDVVLPICVPITNTITPDKIEPINAPVVIVVIPNPETPPKTIIATAPQDAPEDIPSIYGSDIGFLVTHCIRTPHNARPPPQIAPSKTLGNLISHIILSYILFRLDSNKTPSYNLFKSTLYTIPGSI